MTTENETYNKQVHQDLYEKALKAPKSYGKRVSKYTKIHDTIAVMRKKNYSIAAISNWLRENNFPNSMAGLSVYIKKNVK